MYIAINILITILTREEITFRQLSLIIGIILFIVLPFYFIGQSAANMDRQAGLATAEIPTWWKRILFFNQPNPFRKRTILFQMYIVLGLFFTFVNIFFRNSSVAIGIIRWHYRGLLILAVICDIKLRRSIKRPSTITKQD